MPFNYQTLRNLTNQSFVSSTLQGVDFAANAITSTNLANTTITANEMGVGSVDLGGTKVTGSVAVASGGTGLAGFAGANLLLGVNDSNNAYTFRDSGIRSMQVFTGNGTWSRPTGVRFIHVILVGGGGGASGHGESGAAGGYSERLIDVTGTSSVSVTIGGGGGGTFYSGPGGNGSATSFGPFLSASGGHGANRHNQHNGGLSGVGSGGDVNLHQGSGGGHEQRSSGMGGSTYFGGAGPAGHPQGGNYAHNHQGHSAPGTGGTSGYFSSNRGADGRPGIVVVYEFF
jgi:hypothetical protein